MPKDDASTEFVEYQRTPVRLLSTSLRPQQRQKAMAEYLATYQWLRRRLARTFTKELLFQLLASEAWAIAVAAAVLLGIVLAEALLGFTSSMRMLLWYGWVGLSAALVVGAAAVPLVRFLAGRTPERLERLALRIGKVYPQLGDMLCNVLQLVAGLGKQRGVSEELALAALAQVARQAQAVDFDAVIDRRRLRRAALVLFSVGGLAAVSLGVVEPLRSALHRVVAWYVVPPAPFTLHLDPWRMVVPRGTSATVRVVARGTPPEAIQLYVLPEGGKKEVYEVRAREPGTFVVELGPLTASLRFYAAAPWMGEWVTSVEGIIQVVDKPIIRALSGEIEPPAYTRLQPLRIDEATPEVVVPAGSTLRLTVETNKALRAAWVRFVGDQVPAMRYPLEVQGNTARGTVPIAYSGSWAVFVTDSDGQTNEQPMWYRVSVVEDAPPQITLLQPTSDVELSQKGILPIRVSISDDYGFSRLYLYYRLAASRYAPPQQQFHRLAIPFIPQSTVQEVPYLWDLNPLKFSPGDRYEFYVEVWDNNPFRPQWARTPTLSVVLPSLEQILRQAESMQERVAEELQELAQRMEQLRRQSEELRRQATSPASRQGQTQWQQQRQVQALLEQHQDIQQRVEALQQQLEEVAQRLEQAQAISPETLQKYRELQQLLREVQSPQLQQMMERLRQALQQMSPEQLRQALQNVRFNEEEFRAALERTLRLLKRLQAEQKLDALRQRLERLAEQQEALHRQTEQARSPEKLAELEQQQAELQRQWEQLQQEWRQTEQLLREVMPETPPNALQSAAQQMQNPQVGQSFQQARSQLRQGQPRQAQQAQRQAASHLRSAAAAVEQLWNELQQTLSREVQRQLQKAILDALALSEQQEQLRAQTQPVPPGSQRLAELARRQRELRDATAAVTERVMGVAQKSFAITPQMARELGIALRAMQQAAAQLAERMPTTAVNAQQEAMEALNRSALLLQDALSTLQAAGSGACPNPGMGQGAGGMSFLEQLQQLALQQQGITQALQQLFQGRLTMEQQAQLARLAAQQAQVQQALEELSRQQQAPGGERVLGDLRRLAQEMRELVDELRSGNVTMETLRRQHRILSRMLDAMRSLYERDYEPQRESRPGQDIVRPSPPGLRLPDVQPASAPEELLRILRGSYSRDYQRLIERYFELLRRQSVPSPVEQ